MSITLVTSPVRSPSLDEAGIAQFTDQSGHVMSMEAVVLPDASGNVAFGSAVVAAGKTSQVTNRPGGLSVTTPAGFKLPVRALVSLDTSGNPVPFVAGTATKVSGKFQSTVQTGTGSSQNVAHGLGVVPSLVLVAPYDNSASGSTPFTFTIAEGAHDSTNVKVTATSGLTYKVIAFA